jgi:hypothetical protein
VRGAPRRSFFMRRGDVARIARLRGGVVKERRMRASARWCGAPSGGGGGAPAGGGARARSEPDLGRAGHGHDASMRRRWRRVLLAAPPTISLLPPSSRPSLVEAARRASMPAAAAAVLCPGESRRRKLRASAATAFVRGVAVQALACSTSSGGGC